MNTFDRLTWYAIRQPQAMAIALHLYVETVDRDHLVAEPLVLTRTVEGRIYPPALEISEDGAQRLMDALWTAGLRPTEGTGSAGALAATQLHLKDLQAINGRLLALVERQP